MWTAVRPAGFRSARWSDQVSFELRQFVVTEIIGVETFRQIDDERAGEPPMDHLGSPPARLVAVHQKDDPWHLV